MSKAFLAVALFALATVVPFSTRADLNPDTAQISATPFQLLVIEADGCIYCDLFRRDVLPAYEKSEQGKQSPAQFLDINDTDSAKLDLKSPIDIVPTFIVVKNRKEIGRVPGYIGPENFFHAISYLLASAP